MTSRTPQRTCRACRRKKDKGVLLRMTIQGKTLEADPGHTKPGRGWYLCAEEPCLRCLTTDKGRRKAFGRDLLIGPQLRLMLMKTPGGGHGREDESV